MVSGYRAWLPFAGAVMLLTVSLMLLNRLPRSMGNDATRTFASIEEARRELGIRNVPVAAYFPQSIAWPPARILAQSRPFPAVLMEFHRAGSKDVALVIVQAKDESFARNSSFEMLRVTEQVPHTIKGRDAVLTVGACKNEQPCSSISWNDGDSRVTVEMKSTPFELIKIAEGIAR